MARKDTDTRQREIIEATLEQLGESGTQNLTTARIAKRVGISEAALYRHFDGKFDIIGSTIEYVGSRMRREISNLPKKESVLEELEGVFSRHLEYIEEHPGNARLLFSDDIYFDDEELRDLLRGVVEERRKYIQELVEKGQRQGVIRDDMDSEGIAFMFIGLIQSKVLLWSLSGREGSLVEKGKTLWNDFSSSIEA